VRRFYPIPQATTCTTCGTDVAATPEGETYSRQTVVTFDDSPVSATYCSNRCVNEDNERLVAEAFPVDAALREVRKVKAPTKRAALVARYVLELKTQEQVNEFTAELRRQAGVQDVSLLPETTWKVRRSVQTHGAGYEYTTEVLLNTLKDAEDVSISWPSVTFHWGVMVTFTWGLERIVAHSADYQLTETYLSS
jgi:endogenous inhibitor of DNA gyrase (YacG/DUF329 family)